LCFQHRESVVSGEGVVGEMPELEVGGFLDILLPALGGVDREDD
jgi:hypothetical protein